LKIAFIYPEFLGPFGGERHVFRVMNELCKKHTIHLFTPKLSSAWKKEMNRKIKVVETGCVHTNLHNLSTFMQLCWLRRVKLTEKYDYIFCFQWQTVYAGARNKENGILVYFCNENISF